jgi:hypothetical protein
MRVGEVAPPLFTGRVAGVHDDLVTVSGVLHR